MDIKAGAQMMRVQEQVLQKMAREKSLKHSKLVVKSMD